MSKAKAVIVIKNGKVVNPQNAKLPKSNKEAKETEPQKAKTPAEEIGALKAEVNKVAAGLQAVTKEVAKLHELEQDTSALKIGVKNQLIDLRKQIQTQIVALRASEQELLYGNGFRAGIMHIVNVAEGFILEHYHAKDRQELFNNNNMPSFWIATLVQCLHDSMPVATVPKPAEEVAHDFGNEFTDEATEPGIPRTKKSGQ